MDNFWLDLLNALIPVFVTAVGIIATALTGLLVQYIRLAEAKIKAERPDLYNQLSVFASAAVQIAEQLNKNGVIDVEGRKSFAINYVQKWLDSKGIVASAEDVEQAIEKAVFEELNQYKLGQ